MSEDTREIRLDGDAPLTPLIKAISAAEEGYITLLTRDGSPVAAIVPPQVAASGAATTTHALTRWELAEKYGQPEHFSEAEALRMLGRTDVSPGVVYASRYRDREAAEAYAAANLEHHGHPSLGMIYLAGEGWGGDEGWVGVIDLRPAIEKLKRERH
jgi:antitoxin (DNA-binding transcriptional repressor) of toxin-antitoxin stability system